MNICYIISDIDKAVYFEQTALELRNKGLNVSFILINCTNKTLHHFLMENGFDVFTIEVGSLLKSRKAISICKTVLKRLKPELVHCHLAQANWVGLWASKLASVKVRIYTRHSGKPLKTHWKERMIDFIQNKLATRIIAISRNIDDLLEQQGVSSQKRVLIHHGFQLERFQEPNLIEVNRIRNQYNPFEKKPVIGIIARWLELKGIHHTIDAFETLLKTYPDALLCLFGASENADYSIEIKQKLDQIPEKNRCVVEFEKNVYDLFQLFDIYIHVPVNPNCEAFGQTYVEALAAGIPSIFTLSGIAREFIIHENNALVVPFHDSKSLSDSMVRLLEDQSLREKLSANGIQSVNQLFSFSGYIEKLQQLYAS